jgi:osmotically-inducible protein OsmY
MEHERDPARPEEYQGSDHYLVEHVREALAGDERLGELELQVTVAGERIVVSGTVQTKERRQAVSEVVAGLLPDRTVVNQTTVLAPPAGAQTETLQ